jgi:hypothetical protein
MGFTVSSLIHGAASITGEILALIAPRKLI